MMARFQAPPIRRGDLFRQSALINDAWVGSTSLLTVTNPATGIAIGTVPDLGAEAAQDAVAAAHAALPGWRALAAKDRGLVLRRWAALVQAHEDDLARILTFEQGKPLAEALAEVRSTAAFLDWYAEEARRVYGEVLPGHRADKRMLVTRAPVGVVAAITPWNFPSSMIARKVGPALAVGCTMVLKPSELTPYSALALGVLAQEAGVPRGVFNIVTGRPQPIGDVMVEDSRVAKLSFTGSTRVGKHLAGRCMETMKRISMELGGNAPFIVFDDADLEGALEAAMLAKFRNAGQTCISANRFLVQDGVYDKFARMLADRAAELVLGDGLREETRMGPLINGAAILKVARHADDAVRLGARILTGGATPDAEGRFYEPTVLVDVPAEAAVMSEETFGPLAALHRFTNEAEALAIANDTSAGLAAYLFTRDLARAHRVADGLEYGMVGVNTAVLTSEAAPFGGIKESGQGREGGFHGLDDYLDIKSVCIDVPAAGV
ncbi:NAD-dependent succinate-semialdehyde dehydrogenase [Niveispirillum sp. KHB5.9]|uniref:NAD-dependent succinate-semialdehyde dehydrogenase n=1 Tax=Niveispirillum sp. KHB5.9 TaxID=3400269 RepID=UPI003A87BDC2